MKGRGILFAVHLSTWHLRWSTTGSITTCLTSGHLVFFFMSWSTAMLPTEVTRVRLPATRWSSRLLLSQRSLKNTKTWSTSSSKRSQMRESHWSRSSSILGCCISNRSSLLIGSLMTLIVKTKKVTRHLLRTKTTQEKRKKKRKNQKTTMMRHTVKDSRNLTMT